VFEYTMTCPSFPGARTHEVATARRQPARFIVRTIVGPRL
jgi:hypothetical protein